VEGDSVNEETKYIWADSTELLKDMIQVHQNHGWEPVGEPESILSTDYDKAYWRQQLVKVTA
jgi:hypothetical protein